MKTLSLFILTPFFYILGISTLSAADWKVYVAKYKQDKTCAITYTFDDGWQNIPQWLHRNWKSVALEEPSGFAVFIRNKGHHPSYLE